MSSNEKINGAAVSFIFVFPIVSFSKHSLTKGKEKKVKWKFGGYWTKGLQIFLTDYTQERSSMKL